MNHIASTTLFTLCASALLFAGCGESKTGKQGNEIRSGVKASRSGLLSQKPENASRSMSTPSALPSSIQASGTAVIAPDPSETESNGGDESWSFDEIDLDGDGDGESGSCMYDDESETLFVWTSDRADFGDGQLSEYSLFVWMSEDDSVGFVLEAPDHGLIACAADENGEGGCVVCDVEGTCSAGGDEAFLGEEDVASDDPSGSDDSSSDDFGASDESEDDEA
jgi:hypothetical protein